MSFTPLSIEGSWVFSPQQFGDDRGSFHEVFKLSSLTESLGFAFEVKQVNQSVSKAGVIRGVHWAEVPPGQAKYVFCPRGSIWDVVVDIRLGSPTFGQFAAEELSAKNGKAMLIREGLGHAFLSLEEDTVVNYLCSEPYSPKTEYGINPLDEELNISFASRWDATKFVTSPKDTSAPSLSQANSLGILPRFEG
jgi:dTDP-4-dehydrorhamnose 3,5-epimerase